MLQSFCAPPMVDFNPLPPCGGRLQTAPAPVSSAQFQSTPSVWRETVAVSMVPVILPPISIHSLRVEGDCKVCYWRRICPISIHSLRVEGDANDQQTTSKRPAFQSTPSVWRETAGGVTGAGTRKNFNPLPPCGGRPSKCWTAGEPYRFQSTPSVWRET